MNKKQEQIFKQIYYRDQCKCQKCGKLLNQYTANIAFRIQNEKYKYHKYNLVLTCLDKTCIDYFVIKDVENRNKLINFINNFSGNNLETYVINYLLESNNL